MVNAGKPNGELMRKATINVSRQLERLLALGTGVGTTDAELLERFVSGDDESAGRAFEVIVERYGTMVFRVCRMILQDVHAADDAFQATFLVLARKAHQLRAGDLLGNWLYGVAVRTAQKARATAVHRRIRENQALTWIPATGHNSPDDQSHVELERILHEEINRLPRSYRSAIVVCYLEGLTHAEAAERLQLAETTIRGRLSRARKLLGQRLIRRGVEPYGGLIALGRVVDCASLLLNPTAQATTQSALSFVNRGRAMPSAVSATARGIAEGVLLTMRFSLLKTICAMAVTAVVICAGSALIAQRTALARVQHASLLPNRVTPREPGSEDSVGRAPERRENQGRQSPQADVNADLVKLVAAPIVRTLPVSKDCMVLSYLPDWNFGNVDNLGIGNNDGGVRTLIDWPAIPIDEAASPDRRFLIALYSRKTISHPPASAICVFEITEEWPEQTSWKTKPKYETEPVTTCKFEQGDGWKIIDVTPLIRDRAKRGRKGHGVVLRFLIEDVSSGPVESFSDYKLVSREGVGEWADRRPLLLVVEAPKPT
jgi:RNA polymerase sigma factor (sigma-70 family)